MAEKSIPQEAPAEDLRALLERCLVEIRHAERAEGPDAPFNQNRVDLYADIGAALARRQPIGLRAVEARSARETYTETEKALIGTLNDQLRNALDQRDRLAKEVERLRDEKIDHANAAITGAWHAARLAIDAELDRLDRLHGGGVQAYSRREIGFALTLAGIVPGEG